MEGITRVLIVSDIRLYREGLQSFIERDPRLTATATCRSAGETLEAARDQCPDIVLLDVSMANAIETIRAIRSFNPQTKVLALGLSESADDVVTFAEAGIAGYVCRDASVEALIETIDRAVHAELCCSPKVAAALLNRVGSLAAHGEPKPLAARLTPRERQIVSLVDRGLTNKEISRQLTIEVSTVKNHMHNILEKLRVRTRGEAAARVRASWFASSDAQRRRVSESLS